MSIKEHIAKDNLHHAYLIEGDREEILPEVLAFIESLGTKIFGNGDVVQISADSFKIDDARNLKSLAGERANQEGKKFFIISSNSFLLEAQNALLKMFEEPIEDTHFFVVVPDKSALIKTFVSRFFVISTTGITEGGEAEKFLKMHLNARLNFIKELLIEEDAENEDGEEIIVLDSVRAKALQFLNAVETSLHGKFVKNPTGLTESFAQIFKVREFLRMPGSSVKSLMESLALLIPVL